MINLILSDRVAYIEAALMTITNAITLYLIWAIRNPLPPKLSYEGLREHELLKLGYTIEARSISGRDGFRLSLYGGYLFVIGDRVFAAGVRPNDSQKDHFDWVMKETTRILIETTR